MLCGSGNPASPTLKLSKQTYPKWQNDYDGDDTATFCPCTQIASYRGFLEWNGIVEEYEGENQVERQSLKSFLL